MGRLGSLRPVGRSRLEQTTTGAETRLLHCLPTVVKLPGGPGELEEVPAEPARGVRRHVGIEEEAAELLSGRAGSPGSGDLASGGRRGSGRTAPERSRTDPDGRPRGPGSRVPPRCPRFRVARPAPAAPSPRPRRSCAGHFRTPRMLGPTPGRRSADRGQRRGNRTPAVIPQRVAVVKAP